MIDLDSHEGPSFAGLSNVGNKSTVRFKSIGSGLMPGGKGKLDPLRSPEKTGYGIGRMRRSMMTRWSCLPLK